MFRGGRGGRTILLAAALACAALPVRAQEESAPTPGDRVEAYLERLGLDELRAAQLRERLEGAGPQERQEVGERLGRIYAQMYEAAQDRESRVRIEGLARDLLQRVPEAGSYELRINLAKAQYLEAERLAERHRVRLASEEETAEAIESLRAVQSVFNEVGGRVHRRVDQLERLEERGRGDESELQAQLAEARRLRSLAMYYAGWSSYYLALLTDSPPLAADALQHFAWLLQSPGERTPSTERVPASLMRYEHVARAAMGVALSHSLRGQEVDAKRWLDLVQGAPEAPESVREQLFSHSITVLARARRWADLEWLINERGRRRGGNERLLSVAEARLLAVSTLEAIGRAGPAEGRDAVVRAIAQVALGELVSAGEVGHVLDLMDRYGAMPIGSDGFIVRYARAIREYEKARERHIEIESRNDEPATAPTVAAQYRQAADLFRGAALAEDVDQFGDEAARAGVLEGLALFYGGDFGRAADRLERVHMEAKRPELAEEALWFALVALDRAIEGGRSDAEKRRDQLSALFIERFPASERAARLLIRRAGTDIVDRERAIEVLLSIPPHSPIYDAARRHAAGLLYRHFRAVPGGERDFAAMRFVELAREIVEVEREELRRLDAEQMRERAQGLVLRLRQVLDAVLQMSTPDASVARWALRQIDEVSQLGSIDLSALEGELTFRRMQLALAEGDLRRAAQHAERLRAVGGPYADSADRVMYRRAQERWARRPEEAGLAAETLRFGLRVYRQLRLGGRDMDDAGVQSLVNTLAEAGAAAWRHGGDEVARDEAIRLDATLIGAGLKSREVLRRHAELSEAAEDIEAALESWRSLVSALEAGSEPWYEARYHSLRLLARTDPARARRAMDQHKVLHPDFSSQPEPWGERLRELDRRVPPAPQEPSEDR